MSDNPDNPADAAMSSVSRQTKLKISDQIQYAIANTVLITPEYVRAQNELLRTDPAEFYQQREPFSVAVPEGFRVTYYHEHINLIIAKHIIITLDGGNRLPPAEPLSAICEFFGIGSYESVMYEIHRGTRNSPHILDYTSGELLAKWVAKINNDENLLETHLLFFGVADPEGHRFKAEQISTNDYRVLIDVGTASRFKSDSAVASR